MFCLPLVFSQVDFSLLGFYEKTYNGRIDFETDKNKYFAGENITISLKVKNREPFPLLDAYIVIEIVKDCEKPFQPADSKDCNVIFEKTIYLGHMDKFEERNLVFQYKIPDNIKSGTYRIDVYFSTALATISGYVVKFDPIVYKSIEIENPNKDKEEFPSIQILWTKTRTAGSLSQRGPGVYKDVDLPIEIYLAGDGFKGKVILKICEFNDILCELDLKKYEGIYEKFFECKKNEICKVDMRIPSGKKLTAYSVRMEVLDEKGDLHSLFRGRYVVKGEGVKISKVAISDLSLSPDKLHWVTVSIVGPLDPNREITIARNITIRVEISSGEGIIYQNSSKIDEVSQIEAKVQRFYFNVSQNYEKFKLCVFALKNDKELLDEYCTSVGEYKVTPKTTTAGTFEENKTKLYLVIIAIVLIILIFVIIFMRKTKLLKNKLFLFLGLISSFLAILSINSNVTMAYPCDPAYIKFNPEPLKIVTDDKGNVWYYLKDGTEIYSDPESCEFSGHWCWNTAYSNGIISNVFDLFPCVITGYKKYVAMMSSIDFSFTKEKFINTILSKIDNSNILPIGMNVVDKVNIFNRDFSWDDLFKDPKTCCYKNNEECVSFDEMKNKCGDNCEFQCGYGRVLAQFEYDTIRNYFNNTLNGYSSEVIVSDTTKDDIRMITKRKTTWSLIKYQFISDAMEEFEFKIVTYERYLKINTSTNETISDESKIVRSEEITFSVNHETIYQSFPVSTIVDSGVTVTTSGNCQVKVHAVTRYKVTKNEFGRMPIFLLASAPVGIVIVEEESPIDRIVSYLKEIFRFFGL